MADVNMVRCTITDDMIGKQCFVPVNEETVRWSSHVPYGEPLVGKLTLAGEHINIHHHNLFFACADYVAQNYPETAEDHDNWNTQEKVVEQVKYEFRKVKSFYYYHNKVSGKQQLNLVMKSLSFNSDDFEDPERQKFYMDGIDFMAQKIRVDRDTFVEEVQKLMKARPVCPTCGKRASHRHHKFPQWKINIEKYGRKVIDMPFNIVWYCEDCHSSHAAVRKCDFWDEIKFLAEAYKAGVSVKQHVTEEYAEQMKLIAEESK